MSFKLFQYAYVKIYVNKKIIDAYQMIKLNKNAIYYYLINTLIYSFIYKKKIQKNSRTFTLGNIKLMIIKKKPIIYKFINIFLYFKFNNLFLLINIIYIFQPKTFLA